MVTSADSLTGVLKLRAGTPSDRSYVIRSWVASFNHSPLARALGDKYYAAYAPIVERQLARSQVRIACLVEEPGAIMGFAVVEPSSDTVHYVCVRSGWRKRGVASLLLAKELERVGVKYTHSAPPYIKAPASWVYAPLSGAGLDS